ncbi:ATP-binding protein [Streptomyces sp. NPDC127079]|uniref:ATP-binding protein n=1 Tax=Streptomyces sp. NPDC127079 TaxID=3347132 RepID=UPI00365B4241
MLAGTVLRPRRHDGRRPQPSDLGLTIVHSLVAAHDGHVEVDSAPRQGTTFRILLPRLSDEPTAPVSESGGGAGGRGRPPPRRGGAH